MDGLAPGECRLDAQQMDILAQGGRVSAIVGRGQVSGVRITLVAAPTPQPSSAGVVQ